MSGGHYGIDPRRGKAGAPDLRPIGTPSYGVRTGYFTAQNSAVQSRAATRPVTRPTTRPSTASTRGRNFACCYSNVTLESFAQEADLGGAFDEMMASMRTTSLHNAVVNALMPMFGASEVRLWVLNQETGKLFDPATGETVDGRQSIAGQALMMQDVVNIVHTNDHESYVVGADSELPSLYFPILDGAENGLAVVVMAREKRWMRGEVDLVRALMKKFANYAHFLFPKGSWGAVEHRNGKKNEVLEKLREKLKEMFKCRVVEIWEKDEFSGTYKQFLAANSAFMPIGAAPGVVGAMFKSGCVLNVSDCTEHSDYCAETDGEEHEAVLAMPLNTEQQQLAIVFRGKEDGEEFTVGDEVQVRNLLPLLGKAVVEAVNCDEEYDAMRLKALLEVAESLSGVLDIDSLVPTIMEKACMLLLTERCSLFLVDNTRQFLVTRFHGGLDQAIRMPIDRGIVGHTATTGNIVNIPDAYQDPRFDGRVDKETGFKTKAILTVPIFNNRGEIAGVTEMINKEDGGEFDESDIKMLMAFNVFCGISLDNARLYQASLDLTRQLRGFVEMSSALNKTKTVRDVLTEIAEQAKNVISAARCTFFLRNDEDSTLNQFVSIGEQTEYGTKFAEIVAGERKDKIFTSNEIEDILHPEGKAAPKHSGESADDDFKSSASSNSTTSRVASVFVREQHQVGSKEEVSVCCFPLLTSDSRVLGVMELCARSKIMPEDMKLLDCFSVFATVSIEKDELKEIAEFGEVEVKIKQYMTEEERKSCTVIPKALQIPPEKQDTIFRIDFDAPAWDGNGHFQVIWAIFSTFGLFEEFQITNEKFYKFLSEISQTYNKVPYHNWRHAVDVTQFVTYEIKTAKLENAFTKRELLGLIVAAICHDANHDGFTNVFNVKAETPLGILFKNQSVMETHHCSVAIGVISKEECNLFENLNSTEVKEMWNLVITLILTTDMAKHHEFLKQVAERLTKGPLNNDDAEDRFMEMQLILKCADISNVSRPFELADKWCDVLCEEFFRQGDLEKTSGMEYTSPLNDRAHLDKPKSQIGFYTFVCLPLYQAAAQAIPPLQVNVDQVESNLAIWKSANEAAKSETS